MTRHARDEPIPKKKNDHAANTVIIVCHVTKLFTSDVSLTSLDSKIQSCIKIPSKFMALAFLVVLQI